MSHVNFRQMHGLKLYHSLSLDDLIPALYPFFRHTLSSVRAAVIAALTRVLRTDRKSVLPWLDWRLFRLLFQNLVVENVESMREDTAAAWSLALQHVVPVTQETSSVLSTLMQAVLPGWLDILMTPPGQAVNTAHFWKPSQYDQNASGAYDVDRAILTQDIAIVSPEQTLACRLAACRCLAELLSQWSLQQSDEGPAQLIRAYLTSASSHQISVSCYLIEDWCSRVIPEQAASSPALQSLGALARDALEGQSAISYAETAGLLQQIYANCQQLLGIFRTKGKLPSNRVYQLAQYAEFSVSTARHITGDTFVTLCSAMAGQAKVQALPLLEDLKQKIITDTDRMEALKEAMDVQVFAALAAAAIAVRAIPNKLNPLIRGLMNGLKFETNAELQTRAARSTANLIQYCNSPHCAIKSNPSDKIVKNIASFLFQDTTINPLFVDNKIITSAFFSAPPEAAEDGSSGPGGDAVKARLAGRGALLVIKELSACYHSDLFAKLPRLWDCISEPLLASADGASKSGLDAYLASTGDERVQELLDSMTVLAAVAPIVNETLQVQIRSLLPCASRALQSSHTVVRHVAARVISAICSASLDAGMLFVVDKILPYMGDPLEDSRRRGAIELVSRTQRRILLTALQ